MIRPIRGQINMAILFDIVYFFYILVYIPTALLKGKWHKGFWSRLGCLTPDVKDSLKSNLKPLWIHAVSVGEVLASLDLIERLSRLGPGQPIVCSVVTATGYQVARDRLDDSIRVIYAPLDFSWVVRKFIRLIGPKMYIAMETEIWPNLYLSLKDHGVPIVQVNGRISDQSFKRYRWFPFLKRVLNCVDIFCMQSDQDARRIVELGGKRSNVIITGNLKFDNLPFKKIVDKKDMHFLDDDLLLIAGSTHPGEEDVLLQIFERLRKTFVQLRLVLCPRHVERAQEVIRLVEQHGYGAVGFSVLGQKPLDRNNVVVVDRIGKLKELYAIADLVFIGKTFFVGGGQNMIEPAFFGKPVVVGPLTGNFHDVMRIFLQNRAIVQVQHPEELERQLAVLLEDSEERDRIGAAARRVVEQFQGATGRTIQVIDEKLRETV